jgi:hypothetical protein
MGPKSAGYAMGNSVGLPGNPLDPYELRRWPHDHGSYMDSHSGELWQNH